MDSGIKSEQFTKNQITKQKNKQLNDSVLNETNSKRKSLMNPSTH